MDKLIKRSLLLLLTACSTVAVTKGTVFASTPQFSSTPQVALKPSMTKQDKLEHALFASGCFWKTQYVFSKVPGVVRVRAGYAGGTLKNPTYEQVCTNTTGYAETASVDFDPSKTSYEKLLEIFFSKHNPTTLNRQGPDIGTQYRSAIFYTNPQQKELALAYKDKLEQSHKYAGHIVTQIVPAGKFYDAEEHHQNYFEKHGMVCE